jgi:hypothetical protein
MHYPVHQPNLQDPFTHYPGFSLQTGLPYKYCKSRLTDLLGGRLLKMLGVYKSKNTQSTSLLVLHQRGPDITFKKILS